MEIKFDTRAIDPMYSWLRTAKEKGVRNIFKLNNILKMEPYRIEFARYGLKGLPVCNINYSQAVDFFMNFDKKEFTNKRLQYKKLSFINFYNHLEERYEMIKMFLSLSDKNIELIKSLLVNGLPKKLVKEDLSYTIILIISIGNSMGWPYKNYIDFDVANLGLIEDKTSFCHIIAHEIYHTFFNSLIDDKMTPQEYFFINFAFEGLAVYYNNNAYTIGLESKYTDKMYAIDKSDWDFYNAQFDLLFAYFKKDSIDSMGMSFKEVKELISSHYEQFSFKSLKTGEIKEVSHYPTYYLGCFIWGSIDKAFGKEVLYDTLTNANKFIEIYNKAAIKLGNEKYLI